MVRGLGGPVLRGINCAKLIVIMDANVQIKRICTVLVDSYVAQSSHAVPVDSRVRSVKAVVVPIL